MPLSPVPDEETETQKVGNVLQFICSRVVELGWYPCPSDS